MWLVLDNLICVPAKYAFRIAGRTRPNFRVKNVSRVTCACFKWTLTLRTRTEKRNCLLKLKRLHTHGSEQPRHRALTGRMRNACLCQKWRGQMKHCFAAGSFKEGILDHCDQYYIEMEDISSIFGFWPLPPERLARSPPGLCRGGALTLISVESSRAP